MNGLGPQGENEAVTFLKKRGYQILLRNFKVRLGEIDIIARDGKTLCFVEVKTRMHDRYGDPAEAVTPTKQQRIIRAAQYYLQQQGVADQVACRFDVVTIIQGQTPRLYQDAFQLPQHPH